jgi:hypothetical protein
MKLHMENLKFTDDIAYSNTRLIEFLDPLMREKYGQLCSLMRLVHTPASMTSDRHKRYFVGMIELAQV